MRNNDLVSRVVLITGGTRGIGLEISRVMAQDNSIIIMNYLQDDESAQEANNLIRELSPKSYIHKADVADPDAVRAMFEGISRDFGRLDLLVNNVGPWSSKDFFEATDEDWYKVINGNLSSAFFCIRSALSIMRQQHSGVIINIGAFNSETFPSGDPYSPIYGIAKAALALMSRNLARSEGPFGIRVNTVNVGLIRTESYSSKKPSKLKKQIEKIPLGHFGDRIDIANAVKYLASDDGKYVSGAILSVNGGMWI